MRDKWKVWDFATIWITGILSGSVIGAAALLLLDDQFALVLATGGTMVGQLAAFGWLYRRRVESRIGFDLTWSDLWYLPLGFALEVGLIVLLAPLAQVLLPEQAPVQDLTRALTDPDLRDWVRSAIVLVAVVVGPLVEEILYRGVLLRSLMHKSRRFVIVVTAAVFSLVHVVTLTEPYLATAALVLPPIFVLALVLAWLTLRHDRLGPAIFTHTGFNAVAALVLFIPPEMLGT